MALQGELGEGPAPKPDPLPHKGLNGQSYEIFPYCVINTEALGAFGEQGLQCPLCKKTSLKFSAGGGGLSQSNGLVGEYVWQCTSCQGHRVLCGDNAHILTVAREKANPGMAKTYVFNKMFLTNIFITGNVFRSVFELMEGCRMNPPSKASFIRWNRDAVEPELQQLCEKEEGRIMNSLDGMADPVWDGIVGSDARFDSTRGAWNGSITFMELFRKRMMMVINPNRHDEEFKGKRNPACYFEAAGTKNGWARLTEKYVNVANKVTTIAHDQSATVKKIVTEFCGKVSEFEVWHGAKSTKASYEKEVVQKMSSKVHVQVGAIHYQAIVSVADPTAGGGGRGKGRVLNPLQKRTGHRMRKSLPK